MMHRPVIAHFFFVQETLQTNITTEDAMSVLKSETVNFLHDRQKNVLQRLNRDLNRRSPERSILMKKVVDEKMRLDEAEMFQSDASVEPFEADTKRIECRADLDLIGPVEVWGRKNWFSVDMTTVSLLHSMERSHIDIWDSTKVRHFLSDDGPSTSAAPNITQTKDWWDRPLWAWRKNELLIANAAMLSVEMTESFMQKKLLLPSQQFKVTISNVRDIQLPFNLERYSFWIAPFELFDNTTSLENDKEEAGDRGKRGIKHPLTSTIKNGKNENEMGLRCLEKLNTGRRDGIFYTKLEMIHTIAPSTSEATQQSKDPTRHAMHQDGTEGDWEHRHHGKQDRLKGEQVSRQGVDDGLECNILSCHVQDPGEIESDECNPVTSSLEDPFAVAIHEYNNEGTTAGLSEKETEEKEERGNGDKKLLGAGVGKSDYPVVTWPVCVPIVHKSSTSHDGNSDKSPQSEKNDTIRDNTFEDAAIQDNNYDRSDRFKIPLSTLTWHEKFQSVVVSPNDKKEAIEHGFDTNHTIKERFDSRQLLTLPATSDQNKMPTVDVKSKSSQLDSQGIDIKMLSQIPQKLRSEARLAVAVQQPRKRRKRFRPPKDSHLYNWLSSSSPSEAARSGKKRL